MEESVFPRPEVSGELNKVVEARLHADRPSKFLDRILKLQEHYTGTRAAPVYVITDPETEAVIARQEGASSADVFAAFIRDAIPTEKPPRTSGGSPPR